MRARAGALLVLIILFLLFLYLLVEWFGELGVTI